MKDFIVYHNPDSMGYPAGEVESLAVLTNKKVSADVIGDRVWLITGEGSPRKYYLVSWFFIDSVSSGRVSGFETQIEGVNGQIFSPLIPIHSDSDWFQSFRKNQGNFAWGFSPISEIEAVEKLERLAGI